MLLQNELPPDLLLFINLFGDSAAWLLIFTGFMALLWVLVETRRRGGFIRPEKDDVEEEEITKFLGTIINFGIFIGIAAILTGILTIMLKIPPSNAYEANYGTTYDLLTSISLIIMGLTMIFKPLKDVPWVSVLGVITGAVAAIIVVFMIPQTWLDALGSVVTWNVRWILVIVFILVATLVGLTVKFWMSGIEALSKFISWPPMALIVGIYCLIQGFMVLISGNPIYKF